MGSDAPGNPPDPGVPSGDNTPAAGAEGPPRLTRDGLAQRAPSASGAGRERYRIDRLLGIGSTGHVYLVEDAELERSVAVKVLKADGAADLDSVRQFLREARITASIQHPNVLPVHDIDLTADGRPYFSMDHVHGQTLQTAIECGSGPIASRTSAAMNQLVKVFVDVGHAVASAHHRGIIHQDLKPENILIGDFGEVLVLDWGSARRTRSDPTAEVYGTPLYMSPEQARHEVPDERSDIYCIGASLFHALVRRYPAWSDDPEEFWRKKREGRIDAPTDAERAAVPAPLLAITLKALAPARADRYASVLELVRDLQAYQSGLAVTAYRDSLGAAIARWYRRNRQSVLIAAAAVLVIGVATLALLDERAKRLADWQIVLEDPATDRASVEAHWEGWTRDWSRPSTAAWAFSLGDAERCGVDASGTTIISPLGGFADLSYAHPFRGSLRVEWTAMLRRGGRGNLNCFINARDRTSGYTVHVGGYGESLGVILTRGVEQVFARGKLRETLRPERPYRFLLERDGTRVRFAMDGETLIDAVDADPFEAPRDAGFGFDTYGGQIITVRDIRVWKKPLPELVPASAVAERLFRIGEYAEARTQYAEISETYKGTAMAAEARFRVGLCDLRAGSEIEGVAQMRHFERDFPGHGLVPFAIYERALVALRRGEPEAADLLARVKGYPHHPAVRRMFYDAVDRANAELQPLPVNRVGDPMYPPDMVARVTARLDELAELSRLSGAPFDEAVPQLLAILQWHGADEEILARFQADHPRASALNSMGRHEEVLRLYPHLYVQRAAAMQGAGRVEELLRQPDLGTTTRVAILYHAGRVEETPIQDRQWWLWKLLAERYDDILREHPEQEDAVVLALVRSGRAQQALERARSDHWKAEALCALGRHEEVLALPGDVEHPWCTALHRYKSGRKAEARELIALLCGAPQYANCGRAGWFPRHILPIYLDALDGATDWEARLAAVADDHPWLDGQRAAHVARRIAGRIDDEGLLAMPHKPQQPFYLLLAKAVRADLQGDREAARTLYGEITALPAWARDDEDFLGEFLRWRLEATR